MDFPSIRNPKEIRRLVGYMPDFFGVYDDMKVIEYLEFFAAAYRIRGPQRRKVCDEMLEIVDLDFKRDAFANTLSREAKPNAWAWPAFCCMTPKCCCWMNRSAAWIRGLALKCGIY